MNKKNKIVFSSVVVFITMVILGFYMKEQKEERQELFESLTSIQSSFNKIEIYINNAENDGFTMDETKNMQIFKSLLIAR